MFWHLYSISEANRIFGFDAWSRETLDSKCVLARENRGNFLAIYTARVRITVLANGAHHHPRWSWHRRRSWDLPR